MSFFDALIGRTRLRKPDLDPLFRLASVRPDLFARGITLTGRAALTYRLVDAKEFDDAERRSHEALRLYAGEHQVSLDVKDDDVGYRWIIVAGGGEDDDRVTALHVVADILGEEGYGGELLAAVFPATDHRGDAFLLVYNYKRSAFYPFCPTGRDTRDTAREIAIGAVLESSLPTERDTERWYALWGAPL